MTVAGGDGAVFQARIDLGDLVLDSLVNLAVKIMVGSQANGSDEVAAGELTILSELDQVEDARGDELHGAGDQAGVRFGDGVPLVIVDADAVQASIASDFDQSAVAGLAASAEDHVRTVVNGLLGSCGAPFGVGEGHIQTTGVVGGDDVDVGIDVLGAGFITFLEGHDRGNQVGAKDGGDGAGLGHLGSQSTRQEAGLVFGEDQAGQVGDSAFPLALVNTDEVDVRVFIGGFNGGGCPWQSPR